MIEIFLLVKVGKNKMWDAVGYYDENKRNENEKERKR